jgi:energy-coupling factor transporter ATP-binding protein EcfA2
VSGRLAALLELGSGFNLEFTGRENVYLNASILGLNKRDIEARLPDIVQFADIGEHLDQPVRTYSSGMVLRLAFSVSAHIDPEVLIVDEALAVGDLVFRQRCMRRVHQLQAKGCTILFVSHDTGDVKALCQRCLWLHGGEMKLIGPSSRVISKYLAATFHGEVPPELETEAGSVDATHRYGDGRAFITSVLTLDVEGTVLQQLPGGVPVRLQIDFQVRGDIASPIVGYLVRNSKGETLFGSNNAREDAPLPAMSAGETHTVTFEWTSPELAPGRYTVSVAVSDGTTESFQVCDYAEDVVTVSVAEGEYPIWGYMRLECESVDVKILPPDA